MSGRESAIIAKLLWDLYLACVKVASSINGILCSNRFNVKRLVTGYLHDVLGLNRTCTSLMTQGKLYKLLLFLQNVADSTVSQRVILHFRYIPGYWGGIGVGNAPILVRYRSKQLLR